MSNEVLSAGVFGNKNVSPSVKTFLVALMAGGTYEKYTDDFGALSLGSMVIQRGGVRQYLCITPGVVSSLERSACATKLKGMGIDKFLPIEKILDGEVSDKEVYSAMAKNYKGGYNLAEAKFGTSYSEVNLNGIKDFMEVLRQKDGYFTNNPEIIPEVLKNMAAAYGISNDAAEQSKK